MENSLHENLYNVVNSIIFCSKEASASVVLDIVFSLTWPASMQIYWNKIKRLHKKRLQLPEDWFGTPKEDPDIENDLKPLLQAYKNAPTKDSKTQILSIYANNYPAKKLIEMHKFYEPLTEWELRKAKIHANHNGPGAPLEKPVYHRVKLDSVKVTHFLEFINRPYFHQDVAYGTRTLKVTRPSFFLGGYHRALHEKLDLLTFTHEQI